MRSPVEEAIILVGGLGTRLRGVVGDLPKPLAAVAGRPFLAHVLDRLDVAGMRRVVLATGYLGEQVRQAMGVRWGGMQVDYSVEDSPRGTGGAVALAARQLHGQDAFVLNGDTFLRFDPPALEAVVARTGAVLGMAVAQVQDAGRYGRVELAGERALGFTEKGAGGPGYINAGSYLLTRAAIDALPDEPAYSFEDEVLRPLTAAGRVAVLVDTSDFIDIGVPEDYWRAQASLGTPT